MDRSLIRVPVRRPRSAAGSVGHAFKGVAFGPVFWGLAAMQGGPGVAFRARSLALGLRGLVGLPRRLPLSSVFHLLFMPMESTRYFEFDFAWQALAARPLQHYLDVSSPRLFPVALLRSRPQLHAELLNPNRSDLDETRSLAAAAGIAGRCGLHDCLIEQARFAPASFDAITSISVIEHIPDDSAALKVMWSLLRPGGVLVLTVPCMAQAAEQYIDHDEWGLLEKDEKGQVFWQRFYDGELLEQRIFGVTGRPQQSVIYGEKERGTLLRNSERKRADPYYPYWREPYMMAREYCRYDRVEELPGEGVIGLSFVKPA